MEGFFTFSFLSRHEIPKSRQKTCRYFRIPGRIAFQGFWKKGLYSNLRIFMCDVLFYKRFQCVLSFCRFVYLYLQMLESYPFDFH